MLTRKTEPHQKCSSRKPPSSGPTAAPTAATALQMPMASARSRRSGKTWRRIDRVAGMIIAPPTPSSARATISTWALSREGRQAGGDAEQRVPEQQDPSAADPVAQRAEQDQQRGADQRVDVDDPEQFDRAGPQVLGDGGDRHVQHGGVDGDEQQADAEDDEDHPAVGTGPGRPTAQRSGGRGRPGHVRTSQMFPRDRRAHGVGDAPATRPERSGVSGPRKRKASDTSAYASPRWSLVADLSQSRRKDVAYATPLCVDHAPAGRPVPRRVDNRARDRSRDARGCPVPRRGAAPGGPGARWGTRPCAPWACSPWPCGARRGTRARTRC